MIIDTNVDPTPHLAGLKAAPVTTLFGYLDPIGANNPKVMTPERARKLAEAGIRIGLVSEGWGDFAHGGVSAGAGERDALNALRALPGLGAGNGACTYFAVDVDATVAQVQKLVLPYFQAIQRVFAGTKYRFGVYGSGLVCTAVAELTPMAWLSCSTGWTGSKDFLASNKWTLRQHPPSVVAGVPCDVDDAYVPHDPDIGDWMASGLIIPPEAVPAPPDLQA